MLKSTFNILRDVARTNPRSVALLVLLGTAISGLELLPAVVLGMLVHALTSTSWQVVPLIIAYGIILAFSSAFASLVTILYGRLEQTLQNEYFYSAASKTLSMPVVERSLLDTSEIAFTIDSGAAGLRELLFTVYNTFMRPLLTLIIGLPFIWINAGVSVVVVYITVAGLLVIVAQPIIRKHMHASMSLNQSSILSFSVMSDNLGFWKDTARLRAEAFLANRHRESRIQVARAAISAYAWSAALASTQAGILYAGLALMLGMSYFQGSLTPGGGVALAGIFLAALKPLERMGYGVSSVSSAIAKLDKVEDLMLCPAEAGQRVAMSDVQTFMDSCNTFDGSAEPCNFIKVGATNTCMVHAPNGNTLSWRGLIAGTADGQVLISVSDGEAIDGRPTWVRGESGTGKSIVLDALTGCGPIRAGRVKTPIGKNSKLSVGYVRQNASLLVATIGDNVMLGRSNLEAVHQIFERLDLSSFLKDERLSSEISDDTRGISGGERLRILLTRELVQQPDFLVLDEPTTGLDAASRLRVWEFLTDLSKTMPLVISTHDPDAPIRATDTQCFVQRIERGAEPRESD